MWGEEKKSNYIKHATREYNIQRTLNHPRLVGLLDVFEIDVNSFCTGSAPPPPHSPRHLFPCPVVLLVGLTKADNGLLRVQCSGTRTARTSIRS